MEVERTRASRAAELVGGAERRRSERMAWRIPLVLTWRPRISVTVREQAETEIVNSHGARLKLATILQPGKRIAIQGRAGRATRVATVRWNRMGRDGRPRLGIELDQPGLGFWSELAR